MVEEGRKESVDVMAGDWFIAFDASKSLKAQATSKETFETFRFGFDGGLCSEETTLSVEEEEEKEERRRATTHKHVVWEKRRRITRESRNRRRDEENRDVVRRVRGRFGNVCEQIREFRRRRPVDWPNGTLVPR